MAPLAEANARQHETIERQAEPLVGQAETIGRQGAELEQARTAAGQLRAAEISRRRENHRLTIALAVLATLLVLALVAPAWVR